MIMFYLIEPYKGEQSMILSKSLLAFSINLIFPAGDTIHEAG